MKKIVFYISVLALLMSLTNTGLHLYSGTIAIYGISETWEKFGTGFSVLVCELAIFVFTLKGKRRVSLLTAIMSSTLISYYMISVNFSWLKVFPAIILPIIFGLVSYFFAEFIGEDLKEFDKTDDLHTEIEKYQVELAEYEIIVSNCEAEKRAISAKLLEVSKEVEAFRQKNDKTKHELEEKGKHVSDMLIESQKMLESVKNMPISEQNGYFFTKNEVVELFPVIRRVYDNRDIKPKNAEKALKELNEAISGKK